MWINVHFFYMLCAISSGKVGEKWGFLSVWRVVTVHNVTKRAWVFYTLWTQGDFCQSVRSPVSVHYCVWNMHVDISVCALLMIRLRLIPGFIAADECPSICDELMNTLPWQQETVVNGDETYVQPRLTAWFGDLPYSYAGVSHPPYTEVHTRWSDKKWAVLKVW